MLEVVLVWIITAFTLYVGVFWLIVAFENRAVLRAQQKPVRWPSLSVIVPAYNEEKTISSCLKSLISLKYPKKPQIIVVDDGSVDGTAREVLRIAAAHKNITLISQPNRGKGAALNAGLRHAKGELVAVMDADSTIEPGIMDSLVGCFSEPRVGAAIAAVMTAKPARLLTRMQTAEYIISCLYRRLGSLTGTLYVTPGAFSVFRRAALRDVGGFDERNLTEDMEIALRLQSKGWRIKNSMVATAYTQLPETPRDLYRQRIRWYRGLLENTWKYRRMLFNPRHGLLGMWQLPMNIIFPFISLTVIAMFVVFGAVWAYQTALELSIAGASLTLPSLERALLGLDWRFALPWAMTFTFGLAILAFSCHEMRERVSKSIGRFGALAFLLTYYTIINVIWFIAFFKTLARSGRKW
ncbi:MAG: glycosyltransferase family 2 protein [Candidatus Aenigmatarchaeota archaeon]